MKIPYTVFRKVVTVGLVATDFIVVGLATVKVWGTLLKKLGLLMARRAVRQSNKSMLQK
ncbi:MAG: hypothetical protein LHV68_05170 [Elusimicrobia bacterium]|nr:hypothetical protein [Candidatus Liberimonas magnetica]